MVADVTVMDRLMRRVESDSNGCLVWQGSQAGAGYGVISVNAQGKLGYVHRIAYQHFVSDIPADLEIDHLCRNRLCVNPMHLEAVTHAENRRRARQETCKRGHALADGRPVAGHGRACRKCDAIRAASYRARKKAHL